MASTAVIFLSGSFGVWSRIAWLSILAQANHLLPVGVLDVSAVRIGLYAKRSCEIGEDYREKGLARGSLLSPETSQANAGELPASRGWEEISIGRPDVGL